VLNGKVLDDRLQVKGIALSDTDPSYLQGLVLLHEIRSLVDPVIIDFGKFFL